MTHSKAPKERSTYNLYYLKIVKHGALAGLCFTMTSTFIAQGVENLTFIMTFIMCISLFLGVIMLAKDEVSTILSKEKFDPEVRVGASIFSLWLMFAVSFPSIFAAMYALLSGFGPCFTVEEFSVGDSFYFSYTTFTTLGYGDFAPIGACRVFALLEAMTGYSFIGVIVGFSVSLMLKMENPTLQRSKADTSKKGAD